MSGITSADFDERMLAHEQSAVARAQKVFAIGVAAYRELLRAAENSKEVRQRLGNLALLESRSKSWGQNYELWSNGITTLQGLAHTFEKDS